MKKLLLICLVGCLSVLQSCKDECKDVTCENGGTCVEGTCDCPDGYAGDTCELVAREGLIGTWSGNTVCPGEPAEAIVFEVTEGTSIDQIVITEAGASEGFVGNVTGVNTFDIEPFTVELLGFVVTTTGDGSVNSSGQLVMNIVAEVQGFGTSACVFTGAK